MSLRRLCNLHLIDPSKILSKQLSIDTTLLESALKLTLFKGDTFRASEDILQPWQSPEILYRLLYGGGHELALFHRNVCKISRLFGAVCWLVLTKSLFNSASDFKVFFSAKWSKSKLLKYVGRSIFYAKMACGRLIFFLDCQTVFFFEKIKRCSLDTELRGRRVSHASPTRKLVTLSSITLRFHSLFDEWMYSWQTQIKAVLRLWFFLNKKKLY